MPATGNYFYDLPDEIRRRIELIVFCQAVGYPKPPREPLQLPRPGRRGCKVAVLCNLQQVQRKLGYMKAR